MGVSTHRKKKKIRERKGSSIFFASYSSLALVPATGGPNSGIGIGITKRFFYKNMSNFSHRVCKRRVKIFVRIKVFFFRCVESCALSVPPGWRAGVWGSFSSPVAWIGKEKKGREGGSNHLFFWYKGRAPTLQKPPPPPPPPLTDQTFIMAEAVERFLSALRRPSPPLPASIVIKNAFK